MLALLCHEARVTANLKRVGQAKKIRTVRDPLTLIENTHAHTHAIPMCTTPSFSFPFFLGGLRFRLRVFLFTFAAVSSAAPASANK